MIAVYDKSQYKSQSLVELCILNFAQEQMSQDEAAFEDTVKLK